MTMMMMTKMTMTQYEDAYHEAWTRMANLEGHKRKRERNEDKKPAAVVPDATLTRAEQCLKVPMTRRDLEASMRLSNDYAKKVISELKNRDLIVLSGYAPVKGSNRPAEVWTTKGYETNVVLTTYERVLAVIGTEPITTLEMMTKTGLTKYQIYHQVRKMHREGTIDKLNKDKPEVGQLDQWVLVQ